jgi:hypothetical protein
MTWSLGDESGIHAMTMYRPRVWRLPRNPMLGNSSAYYYLLIEESGLRGIIMLTWPNLALTWHSVSILQAFKPFHFTYHHL